MNIEQLYRLTEKGIRPAEEDIHALKTLVEEYPFFQAAIFTYLKSLYIHANAIFDKELNRLSITVNDRSALFYYILSEEYDQFFRETGKKEITEDKTGFLLNAFFESRGDTAVDAGLEYTISHSSMATTDYFSYIEATATNEESPDREGESASDLKHQNIIDSFISKSEEDGIRIRIDATRARTISPTLESEDEDELNEDVFFTETLAKIYIKQRKYEKAYKIIKHLSLNYPKKNIYFADQLSFLEKLIINTKYKDTK